MQTCRFGNGQSPCFLREVPHRQILHPMPFYRISGFSDFPKFREIGISENPDCRRFGSPEIRKSGYSDSRKSGLSEFGFLKFLKNGNPFFRAFWFSAFSEHRNIQQSGKKASDVEFAHVEFPLKSMVIWMHPASDSSYAASSLHVSASALNGEAGATEAKCWTSFFFSISVFWRRAQ